MKLAWIACAMVMAMAGAAVHAATTFDDPLLKPAVATPLAAKSRMLSVARSGTRLVAAGPRGHLLLSDDRGATWQQVPLPLSSDLVQVRAPTSREVWVTGHDGVLLRSQDGATSWQKVLDGSVIAKLVVAAYRDAPQAEMAALGERWGKEGADKPIFDLVFANASHGFIVGAFGLLLATEDGGKNWTPWLDRIDNPKARHLYSATWTGEEVLVVGEQGLLARWQPGQTRFEVLAMPYRGSLFGVQGSRTQWLVHGMQGHLLRSVDGGRNWQKVELASTASVVASDCDDAGQCILASQDGALWRLAPMAAKAERLQVKNPGVIFGLAMDGSDGLAMAGTAGLKFESLRR